MARTFTFASTCLSNTTTVLATAAPLTMASWFNTSITAANQTFMGIGDSAAGNYFTIGTSAAGAVVAIASDGANATATSTTTFTADTWYHACGVFASSTSRAAYLNGANKGTNGTSKTPGGTFNYTAIAALRTFGTTAPLFSGKLAECALWTAALSDDEVYELSLGTSPLLVRPASLVGYWPIIGRYSPEIDLSRGTNLTLTGAPPFADHPRVLYPNNNAIGPQK